MMIDCRKKVFFFFVQMARRVFLHDSVSQSLKALGGEDGSVLRWYSCGPTVYDQTHLGHARNYVSVDVAQRILRGYFGRRIAHVMGCTDVDDKILKRAREEKRSATAVARDYEGHFMEAMRELNVLPPLCLTRVTEHIDCIQQYIQHIHDTGFAYMASDGVYFDTAKLGSAYFALRHENAGAQSEDDGSKGKRAASDFALWKLRDDELAWDSPWGRGRPGWHIECSAMIEEALGSGKFLDVHSGGVDLCFPHHNNEIAQTVARYAGKLKYDELFGIFFHVGHLHIQGRKMSKSLKNFVTVREFLSETGPFGSFRGTADAFRMLCLLHPYGSNTNYSTEALAEAKTVFLKLRDFVHEFQAEPLDWSSCDSLRWADEDREFATFALETEGRIRDLLANNLQTADAVHTLLQAVHHARRYCHVSQRKSARKNMAVQSVVESAKEFLSVCGFSVSTQTGVNAGTEVVTTRADAAAAAAVALRSKLRELAQSCGAAETKRELFRASDWARDEVLAKARIEVKDAKNSSTSTWNWKD